MESPWLWQQSHIHSRTNSHLNQQPDVASPKGSLFEGNNTTDSNSWDFMESLHFLAENSSRGSCAEGQRWRHDCSLFTTEPPILSMFPICQYMLELFANEYIRICLKLCSEILDISQFAQDQDGASVFVDSGVLASAKSSSMASNFTLLGIRCQPKSSCTMLWPRTDFSNFKF